MKANVKKLSPFIVGDSRYGIKIAPIKRARRGCEIIGENGRHCERKKIKRYWPIPTVWWDLCVKHARESGCLKKRPK